MSPPFFCFFVVLSRLVCLSAHGYGLVGVIISASFVFFQANRSKNRAATGKGKAAVREKKKKHIPIVKENWCMGGRKQRHY